MSSGTFLAVTGIGIIIAIFSLAIAFAIEDRNKKQ